jgi:hypothetical protein
MDDRNIWRQIIDFIIFYLLLLYHILKDAKFSLVMPAEPRKKCDCGDHKSKVCKRQQTWLRLKGVKIETSLRIIGHTTVCHN